MDELRTLFWLSALYNFHLRAVYIQSSRNMIADAVSRFHEGANLVLSHSLLCARFPRSAVNDMTLADHISVYSGFFIFSRCMRPTPGLATAKETTSILASICLQNLRRRRTKRIVTRSSASANTWATGRFPLKWIICFSTPHSSLEACEHLLSGATLINYRPT